jgi:hypothetical protein
LTDKISKKYSFSGNEELVSLMMKNTHLHSSYYKKITTGKEKNVKRKFTVKTNKITGSNSFAPLQRTITEISLPWQKCKKT